MVKRVKKKATKASTKTMKKAARKPRVAKTRKVVKKRRKTRRDATAQERMWGGVLAGQRHRVHGKPARRSPGAGGMVG